MQSFRLRNAGWALIGQAADRGAIFLTTILLARTLSHDEFSEFGFFQMTVATLSAFSALGVGTAASRLFARWNSGDAASIEWVAPLWIACSVAGLAVSLISFATASFWHPFPDQLNVTLHVVTISVVTMGIVAQGGLLGLGLFLEATFIAVAAGCATLAVGIYAAWSESVFWAQSSVLTGAAVTTVLSSGIVVRRLPLEQVLTVQHLSPTGFLSLSKLIGPLSLVTILATSGNWLVGRILLTDPSRGAVDFAALVVGLQWFGMVLLLPAMITRAAFPALAGVLESSHEARKKRQHTLLRSLKWAGGSAFAIALIFCALSPFLEQMYGGRSFNSTLLSLFSLAAVTGACANSVGNALIAAGKSVAWLIITIIWFLLLVFLVWSMRHLGALGAALSLGAAGVVMTVSALWTARRVDLI